MLKVVHLIPYDDIGGVETAARTMRGISSGNIEFEINYIFRGVTHAKQRWLTFNPLSLFAAAWRVGTDKTDLLIVSLWRSAIVGLLIKLFRPELKLVVFIHNTRDAHCLDYIFTRLAVRFASEIWADSNASLHERLPRLNPEKSRVISFVTQHIEALPVRGVSPDFIFWGRISQQKGVERALRIFSEIKKHHPDAQFSIIGPDGGDLRTVQRLCNTRGLSDSVFFPGNMSLEEIKNHARESSFYLQTSLFEGMAMSVVEAMQLGLLPVVTPVGEIAAYCKHVENALIVDSDQKAVDEIISILSDDMKYQLLRSRAIETWIDKPLYVQDVLSACGALLTDTG